MNQPEPELFFALYLASALLFWNSRPFELFTNLIFYLKAMNLTPLKSAGKPSCTKAVTLKYGGANIHLKQGGTITVNGKEISTIPVMAGDIRIRAASSLFLIGNRIIAKICFYIFAVF